jgi:hypothetical protein
MGDDRILGELMAQMELQVMAHKTSFNHIFLYLKDATLADAPQVNI